MRIAADEHERGDEPPEAHASTLARGRSRATRIARFEKAAAPRVRALADAAKQPPPPAPAPGAPAAPAVTPSKSAPKKSAPTKSAPKKTAATKAAAAPTVAPDEEYIAGHLLNDHLGGPGVDVNLAPIPKKVNSKMSTAIETPATEIVNKQHGWIRYEVTITHATDTKHPTQPTLEYPSRIDASMGVYDQDGNVKNTQTSAIDIDPPSQYRANSAANSAAQGSFSGAAIETTPMTFDSIILSKDSDIRPLMRNSAEIYAMLVESQIETSVDNTAFATAWGEILKAIHVYEVAAIPSLDRLDAATTALRVWKTDLAAQHYLSTVTISSIAKAIEDAMTAAKAFTKTANGHLQQAAIAVKGLSPADLFRDTTFLVTLEQLVTDLPGDRSLLEAKQAQAASAVPQIAYSHARGVASGDGAATKDAAQKLDDFRNQPHPVVPATYTRVVSPPRVFEQTGQTFANLERATMFGVVPQSSRNQQVVAEFRRLALAGESTGLEELKLLGKSNARARSIWKLLKAPLAAGLAGSPKTGKKFEGVETGIMDSLDALARNEPDVALVLYKIFKV